jgi:hypothetical protein
MESSLSWHDELTQSVIACALQVHNVLGPGFAERIYRRALVVELRKQNISIEIEKDVSIHYDQRIIGRPPPRSRRRPRTHHRTKNRRLPEHGALRASQILSKKQQDYTAPY